MKDYYILLFKSMGSIVISSGNSILPAKILIADHFQKYPNLLTDFSGPIFEA
jgi:hypothetical protein